MTIESVRWSCRHGKQHWSTYLFFRLGRSRGSIPFHRCRTHLCYLESGRGILCREACQTPWLGWQDRCALIRELHRSPLQFQYSSSQATLSWHVYARSISSCRILYRDTGHLPILKPYLDRPLGHADILRDTFPDGGRRCGVSDEFVFECEELLLCRSLPFLIFLLLGKRALAWWSARCRRPRSPSSGRDGGRGC